MLMDLQSMFSDKQAITVTAASTNVIDFGAAGTPKHAKAAVTRDIGKGRPIPIVVTVNQTFTDVGSDATLTVALQVHDDDAFGAPTTVVSQVFALATLVAGVDLPPFYVPEGVKQRYARLYYTVTSGPMTAGKITAGLVFGKSNWTA